MKRCIICLCTLLFLSSALGQESRVAKEKYVAVPPENIFLVVASQPECPIQLEESTLLLSTDTGQWGATSLIRNRGHKGIRYFVSSIWTSIGTGGTLNGSEWSSGKVSGNLLMPGQTIKESCEGEIIPLTGELRKKLKLDGPMRAVAVLIVDRVVFDDGSTYSAEKSSQALQKYLTKLSETGPER